MARARILVVEDEWFVAEELFSVLEAAGHDVVGPASSVRQAAKLIESESIDAAVLDVGLIGETSEALIPMLRVREIPFVFASGYAASDLPPDMRLFKILPKPVAATPLIEAVRAMLRPVGRD